MRRTIMVLASLDTCCEHLRCPALPTYGLACCLTVSEVIWLYMMIGSVFPIVHCTSRKNGRSALLSCVEI